MDNTNFETSAKALIFSQLIAELIETLREVIPQCYHKLENAPVGFNLITYMEHEGEILYIPITLTGVKGLKLTMDRDELVTVEISELVDAIIKAFNKAIGGDNASH